MRKSLYYVLSQTWLWNKHKAYKGNYSAKIQGELIVIRLFNNPICVINNYAQKVYLSHCNYYTRTTQTAINSLADYFGVYSTYKVEIID